MREAQELREATEEYYAYPLEENLFEWHFTVRGPPSSDFAVGVYHGRILLPPEYPMKPPNIILLTVSHLVHDLPYYAVCQFNQSAENIIIRKSTLEICYF